MGIFDFEEITALKMAAAEEKARDSFRAIEKTARKNQEKMLKAFISSRVAETDLHGTTGYGYSDSGKRKASLVLSKVFGCEDALISYDFACGTHTLTVALFALLRPGDTMLCVTGRPYDTICPVIGMDGADNSGSLSDFGINYRELELKDGKIDIDSMKEELKDKKIKLVYIQRSRGYTLRRSLSSEEIGEAARAVHSSSDAVVMVDNCYGEFVDETEPTQLGADLAVGSLIKNAGGGIAKRGGYAAGKSELVKLVSYRLTAPSLGAEVGASIESDRDILMGLFMAPHVTGEALKTAVFASYMAHEFGFDSSPEPWEERHDIVQALKLKTSENLIGFCRGLQSASAVDSHLKPEPWDMPGYKDKVIMASGSFTSGSSIELSGDAPLREPFAVWMQGGLNFDSARLGVGAAFDNIAKLFSGS